MSDYPNLESSPKCPYCGHEHSDAWEWDFGPGLEGDTETDCGECGRVFKAYREVPVYYRTFKVRDQ